MTTLSATSGIGEYWPNGWPYYPPPAPYTPPMFPSPPMTPIVNCPIYVFPGMPCTKCSRPGTTVYHSGPCPDSAEAKLIVAARELLEARGYVVVAPAGETP